jgi:nicotinamidase-related amidase
MTARVLALIDYQPEQYAGVTSVGHGELLAHVTMLGRIATVFELPVVLSTVYVKHGMSGTNPELREALPGVPEIDRTSMNSWEDPDFRRAVERTGRKKLVIAGLWTEVCVAFPTLDALREGYEVYVVVDAIGGVSRVAHESAMQRMVQVRCRFRCSALPASSSATRADPMQIGCAGSCGNTSASSGPSRRSRARDLIGQT